MSTGIGPSVGELSPADAWDILATDSNARIVDVRTTAEWGFVGVPDVSEIGHAVICIEWSQYPGMSVNPNFVEAVKHARGIEGPGTMLFLCRSGVRSLHAARAFAAYSAENGVAVECINVAEGFEGDLDSDGHRGRLNGWKLRGLAWRQS
jgi:rhodanese-related sulfurtransferase